MLDTHVKLRNVCAKLNSITLKLAKTVSIIGVAYNHLARGVEELSGELDLAYYDIKQPKGSGLKVLKGNVFEYVPRSLANEVLVDDTLVSSIPDVLKKSNPGLPASAVKLKYVVSKKPYAFACKVSLECFLKVHKMKEWLLSCGYNYVEVAKFGKLHNEEVFVLCSMDPKVRKRCGELLFNTDIYACCVAVHLANNIIQAADALGVRAPMTSDMWRKVVVGLPAMWPWYTKRYDKDQCLSGGTGYADLEEDEVLQLVDPTDDDGELFVYESAPPDLPTVSLEPDNYGVHHVADIEYLMSEALCPETEFKHDKRTKKVAIDLDGPRYALSGDEIRSIAPGTAFDPESIVLRCGKYYVEADDACVMIVDGDGIVVSGCDPSKPSKRQLMDKDWKRKEFSYYNLGESVGDGKIWEVYDAKKAI